METFFLYQNLVKVLLQNTPNFVLKAAVLVYSKSSGSVACALIAFLLLALQLHLC